jgi:hypothetical protein
LHPPLPLASLRSLGIALGLANLLHVRHWSWLLNPNNDYFRAAPVQWQMGATTIAGFLASGALALNGVRQQVRALIFQRSAASVHWSTVAFMAIAALAVLAAAIRWRVQVARALAALMLWSLPFVALTFGQALWAMARPLGVDRRFAEPPAAERLARAAGTPRVLVLVFDGLDQTQALEAPVSRELSAFARLRRQSIECVQAYPPSSWTAMSIPSLLVGRGVLDAARAGPRDLSLRLEGSARRVSWSQEASLFRTARQQGVNVGVVGWYHPYCRVFGSELATCRSHPYTPEPDYSWTGNARRYLGCLVETVPWAVRYDLPARLGLVEPTAGEERQWHADQCRALEVEARQAALDPTLGLVFVHYQVPHLPYIYDPRARQYDTSGARSYEDNLVLADAVLGRLRSAMQDVGLWESSTVIVTADHWNRYQPIPLADSRFPVIGYRPHRVPLLIKLAGQSTRAEHAGTFHTYHIHDLALAILRGELQAPGAVTEWLVRRSEAPPDSPGSRQMR